MGKTDKNKSGAQEEEEEERKEDCTPLYSQSAATRVCLREDKNSDTLKADSNLKQKRN
jgi:hypothetical protein